MPRYGNTKDRDYSWLRPDGSYGHRYIRQQWQPVVARGEAFCNAQPCWLGHRWISPTEPWDLGHSDSRAYWTGPEHRHCNRRNAGIKVRKLQSGRSTKAKYSRAW